MKPNDPLYGKQWHLAQIGGLEKVWDYYSGVGTTVVVYDNGVEASHEDLNDNYVPGGAFTYGGTTYGSVPVSASDAHGTAVAGLIAAEANNGRGGAGVAWGADVAALNFLESVQFSSSSTVLAALRNAANFDVMNNSWGYSPLYQDSQSLAISGSSSLLLEGALAQVATSGRGGLGTVVVNASGNEGLNANGEGILASRHVIAVAASDRYGNVTSYSNWGSNIVVTAPGASYTTDRTGNAGYNMFGAIEPTGSDSLSNLNYTSVFGGTSASAPLVSGVVALMLEANPNLGWRDVKNILALSASQTGSALKAGPSGHELDAWSIQKSGNWNGGGTAFNVNYGFGMVNALSAVGMAEVWSDIYGAARTSSNEAKASGSFSGHLNILDNSTTYAQLNIASNIEVETVMVNVNVTHSYASDLRMALIAPDGSEVTLMHAEGGATLMRGGFQWAFGVEAFRGMSSGGQWRLRIDDLVGGDTGYITGFSVDAYGGASPSFAVHTFTDDFAMFKAVEATRGNLMSTTNGDWLNFAGVSGNMNLTFSAGQAIRLNGQIVAQINAAANFTRLATGAGNDTVTCGVGARQILLGMGDDLLVMDNATGIFSGGSGVDTISYFHAPGGVSLNLGSGNTSGSWAAGDVVREFENAAGSDAGDDSLTGSAVANILSGNGGNDTISGGAQYDTIYGGNGNDIVYGGLGRDSIWLGFGNDHFEDDAQADVHGADLIYGGAGDDTINGGGGDDRFYGEDGADLIYGGLGADMIDGGSRYDTIYSQNGNDTVYGGTGRDYVNLGSDNDRYFDDAQDDAHGSDTVLAGAGHDTINGGGGADLFYGEDGNDLIYAGLGNDTIDGGSWADTIYGQNGFDVVYGGLGPDTVWLGNGDDRFYDDVQADSNGFDTVYGGNGNDQINGGGGDDFFFGEDGLDRIYGGLGSDTIDGGAKNDTIYGQSGDDVVYGGNGRDLVWLSVGNDIFLDNEQDDVFGSDTIYGGDGSDTLNGGGGGDYLDGESGNDSIGGGSGNDIIYGGSNNDTIDGGAQFDVIYGGDGQDVVYGGSGRDYVELGAGNDVFFDDLQNDVFGADTISAGDGADTIHGGGGDDIVDGGPGNDSILSGKGNEIITGGAGADVFVFSAACGTDRVKDFADNVDTLVFDDVLWGSISLSVSQVVTIYCSIVGADALFDFGSGNTVTIAGVSTTGVFLDDLSIV